eukprot:TRINITY_DN3131_c0_g2_i1.p1 TRINITY_DN3131_c0_g2~~TRINITY_DN3131_c0_g2_i1.p1  ORF type:complete len:373 (+),score=74.94 TRINITY_DN3131_c0_g2_i1:178-1296(+)
MVHWTGSRSAMQEARARVAHQTRLLREESSVDRSSELPGRTIVEPTSIRPMEGAPARLQDLEFDLENGGIPGVQALLSSVQRSPSPVRYDYAGNTSDGFIREHNRIATTDAPTPSHTAAPSDAPNFRKAYQDHLDAMSTLPPEGDVATLEALQAADAADDAAYEAACVADIAKLPAEFVPSPAPEGLPVGFEELRVDLLGFLEECVLHDQVHQPELLGGVPGEAHETRPAMPRRPRPPQPDPEPPVFHRSVHQDHSKSDISQDRHTWIKVTRGPAPPAPPEPEPVPEEDKCVVLLGMGGSSFVQSLEYFTKSRRARITLATGKSFMFYNVDSEFIDSYRSQLAIPEQQGAGKLPSCYTTSLEYDATIRDQHI